MAAGRARLERRTIGNDGLQVDEAWPGVGNGFLQRHTYRLGVMAIHIGHHMPAIGGKAHGGIIVHPAGYRPIDGDAVVIVEHDQLAKAPGASQGAGLVGQSLHEAAITHDGIRPVIHDDVTIPVEALGQQALGQRHAHGCCKPLGQRPCAHLHAGGTAVFRMARRAAVQLAERLEIVYGEIIAGQMQEAIEQHGGMPVGKHEAIPVRPGGIGWIVAQELTPQHARRIRKPQRCAGMSGTGHLHRIHGKHPQGMGQQAAVLGCGAILAGACGRHRNGRRCRERACHSMITSQPKSAEDQTDPAP